jgi:hypothetical protein
VRFNNQHCDSTAWLLLLRLLDFVVLSVEPLMLVRSKALMLH